MNSAKNIPLNCGFFSNEASYIFKKPSFGLDRFVLRALPTVSSTGTIIDQITERDLVIQQRTFESSLVDYATNIEQFIPNYSETISVYSTNSGVILAPDSSGIARGVSSGSAALVATANDGAFSAINIVVSGVAGATTSEFIGYANDSLAKESNDAVDTRINSLNAEVAKPIFSSQNHSTANYVRNSDCWASDLDLTCISPWNSTGGSTRAGTLISPRHILFAGHYQINNNATIRFVDNNNNVVTRTMINKLTHPNYGLMPIFGLPIRDLTIGLLDSDVPETISFAKILPSNWFNYLPNIPITDCVSGGFSPSDNIYKIACLATDQEKKALVSDLQWMSMKDKDVFGDSCGFGTVVFNKPTDEQRLAFYEDFIVGDSGSPAFLIINGELVVLTVATSSGAGQSTTICLHTNILNNMMNNLGGGYQLTEIDLSGFTDFS
jgi:hypothetical protein